MKNEKDSKLQHFTAWLTQVMDSQFTIPGTKIRFGLDPILSLIPGVGNALSTGASISIYGLILAKGVPFKTALQMMGNIIIDTIFSSIPLIGTIADIGFKANSKNLKLLQKHQEKNPEGKYYYGVWILFGLTILITIVLLIFFIRLIWNFIAQLLA
ncbi:DUF4112 domain-containing protein [Mesonia sp. K7]|uniref:DUF4112 domain-containing protein n=1 Tax=Mesonia sp. K7 TaxID=2218606 RepID=UPI000DA8E5A4|nr:DUF4112 domain-containing protein [Mesonia sp. K7]PZD78295.1 DUF4112 domain-containing protein [Mesonia sp. K7]